MRGESIASIIGSDRPNPLPVVTYTKPRPKPKGLDWDAMRPIVDDSIDTRVTCSECHEHVDTVSRHTGLCTSCEHDLDPHNQDTPTTQETTMPATPAPEPLPDIPDYAREFADLLIVTEGHSDPLVRSIRKIVTQAALSLRAAHDASRTSGSDATATEQPTNVTNESTSTSGPEPHPTQGERLLLLGVTAQEVRQWAIENGVPVSKGGRLRNDTIDAYQAAHESTAA